MSTTLLAHLRSIGVVLSIDGDGKLAFDAPVNVLTDQLMAKMRSHRDGLWALVEQDVERAAIVQVASGSSRAEPGVVEAPVVEQTRAYLEPMTGVVCPWCRSHAHLVEHDSGLRCGNCNREAWRFKGESIVRCDWGKK